MSIVLITEALMARSTVSDGRILRDRMLSGFCLRMNARKRTCRVATGVAGQSFRINLGYWPLMTVEDTRAWAMVVLIQCRRAMGVQLKALGIKAPMGGTWAIGQLQRDVVNLR